MRIIRCRGAFAPGTHEFPIQAPPPGPSMVSFTVSFVARLSVALDASDFPPSRRGGTRTGAPSPGPCYRAAVPAAGSRSGALAESRVAVHPGARHRHAAVGDHRGPA